MGRDKSFHGAAKRAGKADRVARQRGQVVATRTASHGRLVRESWVKRNFGITTARDIASADEGFLKHWLGI